jgi:hypothetical protein
LYSSFLHYIDCASVLAEMVGFEPTGQLSLAN